MSSSGATLSDNHGVTEPGSRVLGIPLLASHGTPVWPGFLAGQAERPVRVLLIDDDPHIRQVIAQELLSDLRTDVVAQGSSVRDGTRLVATHDFDVLLVDLNLRDGTGFDLIETMKLARPAAEAVVISVMEDEEHAMHAFELGATGYLVKNSWFGSFPQAVLQVANGGASITPSLARRLLSRLRPLSPMLAWSAAGVKQKLSRREREVLKMIAAGYTSSEIGLRLRISHQTVNAHIKNIYRKLQVHSRAEASSVAAQCGMLAP